MEHRRPISLALIVASFIVTAAIWGRFIWSANQPSAPRYMNIQFEGSAAENFLFCFDSAYIEMDDILRNCMYQMIDGESAKDLNVMVRYDMKSGKAEIKWQFPDIYYLAPIAAFAQHSDGDIAIVKDDLLLDENENANGIDGFKLYRLAGDSSTSLLFTTGAGQIPFGLAWVGSTIEFVYGTADNISIVTVQPNGDTSTRNVPNFVCEENQVCRAEFAYFENSEWHFVYSRVPAEVSPEDDLLAELLEATESKTPAMIGSIPLTIERDYKIEDGQFSWLSPYTYLVAAQGNLVNYNTPAFEWDGENWQPLEVPTTTPADFDIVSHYVLADEHLEWLPKIEEEILSPSTFRINSKWIMIEEKIEEILIYPAEEKANEPLQVDENLSNIFTQYKVLAPSSDGGYWFLLTEYEYLRLDENLKRVDSLSFSERVEALFGKADRHSAIAYTENRDLKRISFVLLLFFMPVTTLLVWISTRVRKRVNWYGILVGLSIVYLPMALLFRSWFREMTKLF